MKDNNKAAPYEMLKKNIAVVVLFFVVCLIPFISAAQEVEQQNINGKAVSATSSLSQDSLASSVTQPVTSTPVSAAKTVPAKTNSTSQIANLIGGLILILTLIWGLSWFVKRFSQGGFMQNPAIKMLAAMPLGTRERLMLIDVGGKQILLGVTATQINNLYVFDQPVVIEKGKPSMDSSEFSQKLMAILQQKNTITPNSSPSNDVER